MYQPPKCGVKPVEIVPERYDASNLKRKIFVKKNKKGKLKGKKSSLFSAIKEDIHVIIDSIIS